MGAIFESKILIENNSENIDNKIKE
jgi:hypothetical protein